MEFPVATCLYLIELNGPLIDTFTVSLEKSIRFTADTTAGVGCEPPPNQPKFPPFCGRILEDLACPDVAAKPYLAKLNGPLTDAVEESLEKSIRSTLDVGPGLPPPTQP